MNSSKLWDELHQKYDTGKVISDNFLEGYQSFISNAKLPVLDLACGAGSNSKYLVEHGKKVIACDYSHEAIELIKRDIPDASVLYFDMRDGFPLKNGSADLIICDMGLHFFNKKDTFFIINEIKRVLISDGHVIFRFNAMEDLNQDEVVDIIEPHYYLMREGLSMRYFDKSDIESFFVGMKILTEKRSQMRRYGYPREIWEVLCTVC